MRLEERRRRRFSESFRKEMVGLIEAKKVTVAEVSMMYEVKQENVRRWLKKYGTKQLPKPIIVRSPKEINKFKELERENKELKQIIGTMQVELVYTKKLIELAKEKLGEDFEKKTKPRY